MKLIEWYVDVGRGTIKVDDNATASEIEALIVKEVRKEMFCEWEERTQHCGNCKHYAEFEGVCTNGDSEYRADFTDFDFDCDKWER